MEPMTEMVWIEVLGSPSSGVVADGLAVAAGETVLVSPLTAWRLLAWGRARLVEAPQPTVAETRRRVR